MISVIGPELVADVFRYVMLAWLILFLVNRLIPIAAQRRLGAKLSDTAGLGLFVLLSVLSFFWLYCKLSGIAAIQHPGGKALKFGGLALYFSGCIVYFELQSLLYRGFSLRILQDLLHSGGWATLSALQESYGHGAGIKGLLIKRLGTLSAFQLIVFDGTVVGPLKMPGKICALLSRFFRRFLRLRAVG
ncbi:MAG: hypothetical protein HY747_04030 [Elusimicrobia bacterium]|nr:hypothetical protein [Elusimicrobiota bacterium]